MVNLSSLNDDSIDTYLQENIIPGFLPLVNQDINAILWSYKNTILCATNNYAKSLGFSSWQKMQDLSFSNPDKNIIPILKSCPPDKALYAIEVFKKIAQLRQAVLARGLPINIILIHPFNCTFKTHLLINFIPVFHPKGNVIAVQMFMHSFTLFGIYDYLSGNNEFNMPTIISNPNQLPIPLSARQHEILFLLIIGLSQYDIAEILNIGRSTVSKTILDTLCPRFNVHGNTQNLIANALKSGMNKYIPVSLCRPLIVNIH
jgi:hypothetical protein